MYIQPIKTTFARKATNSFELKKVQSSIQYLALVASNFIVSNSFIRSAANKETVLPTNHPGFFLNNQTDALIFQIYSVIKLYVFRASPLPIIRSSLLCI